MDIGFYIADLLRNQDEVSLPGLGTFSKKSRPATYDPASNFFNPPAYELNFSDITTDFNALRDYISTKKNLSATSAEYFIKKFAAGISELLESSGTADIKPLGVIRQENKSLIFEPSNKLDLSGRFYGLRPIADLRPPSAPVIPSEAVAPAFKESSIESFITSQNTELMEQEEEVLDQPRRRNRTLLLLLGAFLIAVIAAAMLYLFNPRVQNLINQKITKRFTNVPASLDSVKTASAAPVVIADSTISASPTVRNDSLKADSVAAERPVAKRSQPPVKTAMAPTITTTFEIIGAAFGKRSEADRYVSIMKKKGLNARILEEMPGTLFKVSLASFPDFESAKEEFYRIRRDIEPKAWTTPYKSTKTQ